MLKKLLIPFVFLFLLVTLSGCFGGTSITSVRAPYEGQLSHDGYKVLANVTAENRGLFLFNLIPISSGNSNRPNKRLYKMFQNQIKEGYNLRMLHPYIKEYKGNSLELVDSRYSSSGIMTLWLVWRRVLVTDAQVVINDKTE